MSVNISLEEIKKIWPLSAPNIKNINKYVEKYEGETIVIKYGGNVLIDKSIFNIFGLIPWDPPSFMVIGIWPILMGASMWVQQKLNPAPTDPIQAKIFAFFPLFLTIILASFPSGLVVYWTVNNILTIAQQWVINKNTTVKTN